MTVSEPQVGGESARRIVEIIRNFPIGVGFDGEIEFENTAVGEELRVIQRAYEVVELELMVSEMYCSHHHEHRTMTAAESWDVVLRILMEDSLATCEIDPSTNLRWLLWSVL